MNCQPSSRAVCRTESHSSRTSDSSTSANRSRSTSANSTRKWLATTGCPLTPTERESAISRDRRCPISTGRTPPRKKRPTAPSTNRSSRRSTDRMPTVVEITPAAIQRGCATLQRALLQRCATREWRNWQTRRLQVPVPERVWGFKSPLAHNTTTDEAFAERSVGRSLSPRRTAHRFGVVRPRPAWWSPLTGRGRSILRERKVRSSRVPQIPSSPVRTHRNRSCVSLLRRSVHPLPGR